MHAVVAEVFANGAASIGGQELQRGRFRGGGGDHHRVVEGAVILQGLDDLRHRRTLLADRDIDAEQLFALIVAGRVIDLFLVDEGVDGDGGFTSLPVSDD